MLITFDGPEGSMRGLTQIAEKMGFALIEGATLRVNDAATQEQMDNAIFNCLKLNAYQQLSQISLATFWVETYFAGVSERTTKSIMQAMADNDMQFCCGFDPATGMDGPLYTELGVNLSHSVRRHIASGSPTIEMIRYMLPDRRYQVMCELHRYPLDLEALIEALSL